MGRLVKRRLKPPPYRPRDPRGRRKKVYLYPSHELRAELERRAIRAERPVSWVALELLEAGLAAERLDLGDPTEAIAATARARRRELGVSPTVARKLAEKEAASGI